MSKSAAMDLVMQFMGKQNTIPTPVPFIRLLGDHAAAAFLSQCLYWGERTTDADGWFHKTHEEWQDELVLSPDQVRRCTRTCGALVQVKRKGIPARNYYRADRAAVAAALAQLAAGTAVDLSCGETQHQDADTPHDKVPGNPTAGHGQTPQQVVQETPRLGTEPTSEPTQNEHTLVADATARGQGDQEEPITPGAGGQNSSGSAQFLATAEPGQATGTRLVPPAAPPPVDKGVDNRPAPRQTDFARLVGTWNAHRGALPEVQDVTEGRKKAIRKLLADCGGDVERSLQILADATREVAGDEFWQGRRYGFDNLVPGKVFARAEAWRTRPAQLSATPNSAPAPTRSTAAFQVGQRVSYKRDAYTVETVADTFIDLYDDTNGSARVLLASSDWSAVRGLTGGQA